MYPNPKQQIESTTSLSATTEELKITFDFIICDFKHLPTAAARQAGEVVKIQVIESIIGIVGSLQNTKAVWLLDSMRTLPESPWEIPFALLSSKEERLCLAGLTMLDIYLKGAKGNNVDIKKDQRNAAATAQKQFSKMRGFSIVRKMADSWSVTAAILDDTVTIYNRGSYADHLGTFDLT